MIWCAGLTSEALSTKSWMKTKTNTRVSRLAHSLSWHTWSMPFISHSQWTDRFRESCASPSYALIAIVDHFFSNESLFSDGFHWCCWWTLGTQAVWHSDRHVDGSIADQWLEFPHVHQYPTKFNDRNEIVHVHEWGRHAPMNEIHFCLWWWFLTWTWLEVWWILFFILLFKRPCSWDFMNRLNEYSPKSNNRSQMRTTSIDNEFCLSAKILHTVTFLFFHVVILGFAMDVQWDSSNSSWHSLAGKAFSCRTDAGWKLVTLLFPMSICLIPWKMGVIH